MSKKKLLFHGTTKDGKESIEKNGIKLNVNNGFQDFGDGFYLTPNKGLAKDRKKDHAILAYTLDTSNLKVKLYHSMTDDWKEEIFQQRVEGNDVSKGFDCVIGPMADGRMHDLIEAYRDDIISKDDFFSGIANEDWKRRVQVVVKTQKGIEKLKREEEEEK